MEKFNTGIFSKEYLHDTLLISNSMINDYFIRCLKNLTRRKMQIRTTPQEAHANKLRSSLRTQVRDRGGAGEERRREGRLQLKLM